MISDIPPSGVLDIGSFQSKFIIFKVINSNIHILSKTILKTEGIKKGFISDVDKLTKLISELIGKAEDEADLQIKNIYLSISPINSSFISFCSTKNIGGYKIEHEKDVQFLINESVNQFKDCYPSSSIIHLFNFNFRTDKINAIESPVGLIADSFESDIHIIFSKQNILKNFSNIISSINLKIEKFIFSPYVLSFSTYLGSPLSDACMVIDFGHEKTSISIFQNENFLFATTIPIGSWHVTNDISKSLNLNFQIAETLKRNYSSCASLDQNKIHEFLESDISGTKSFKKISNNILNKIVNSRIEEIIDFINKELIYYNFTKQNFNKIVITGEGSKIKGFCDLLKKKIVAKCFLIEKFSNKIKNNFSDDFDVCLSMIYCIQNEYNKEVPSYQKLDKSFFSKIYSIFN